MKKNILLPIIALLLSACNPDTWNLDVVGMVSGSSAGIDQRINDSFRYNDEHGYPVINATGESYNVFVATDTHVDRSRTNWKQFISDYHADPDCPLAIHLGDLINAQNHWDYMAEPLSDLPANPLKKDTLLAVAGNHDLYFNQWKEYVQRFKTSTYYAIVRTPAGKQDLYIFIDTGEGFLGKRQTEWLKSTLTWANSQGFRHITVCTHTHLFKRDSSQGHTSNMPLEETYALLHLLKQNNVEMFWCGHDHSREITSLGNMTSIIVDALFDREPHPAYMVATCGDEPIRYRFVELPPLVD